MQLTPFINKSNPSLHNQCLLLLQACVNYVGFTPISRAVPGMFDGTEGFVQYAGDANTPPMVKAWDAKNVLVVLNGMTLASQAANIVSSWDTANLANAAQGVNPFFAQAATTVMTRVLPSLLPSVTTLRVIGHSFGGAVAHAIRMAYGNPGDPWLHQYVTYGAPRMSSIYLRSMSEDPWVVRNFGFDDVVPSLPPSSTEAPAFHLLLPRGVSRGASTQCQPCNGLAIDGAGNLAASYNPPISIPSFQGAVATWMLGTQGEGSTPQTSQEAPRLARQPSTVPSSPFLLRQRRPTS